MTKDLLGAPAGRVFRCCGRGPASAFRPAASRWQKMLVAAAMLIAAVERLNRRGHRSRANLKLVEDETPSGVKWVPASLTLGELGLLGTR